MVPDTRYEVPGKRQREASPSSVQQGDFFTVGDGMALGGGCFVTFCMEGGGSEPNLTYFTNQDWGCVACFTFSNHQSKRPINCITS